MGALMPICPNLTHPHRAHPFARLARAMVVLRLSLLLVAVGLPCGAPAAEATLTPSQQRPLTVRVVDRAENVLFERILDLAAVDALPQATIRTHTPWTHGLQTFTGPSLATLSALGGYAPSEVRIYSLGEWTGGLPASDWQTQGVILASRLNGEIMRVRDKGPYWIMYPIDARRDLDTQMYQARMVWQVKALEFVVEH